MFITGIGTAAPSQRYTQADCWTVGQTADQVRRLTPRSQHLIRKILLGDSGIDARHIAVDSLVDMLSIDPDALHARFARYAPQLGTEAACRAIARAEIPLDQIDALLVSTCTGYLCPGLTSYMSERLGLRKDCLLLDLVGQGCGAAIPNLRTAEALLGSRRANHVLSVCVEVCSAAFYLDDDPGVLVSACLFGDGAAAAVLAGKPNPGARCVEWKDAWTQLSAENREQLRFEQKGGLLRNILAKEVPQLAGKQVERLLTAALGEHALARGKITTWILHSGGKSILASIRDELRLPDSALQWSAGILREYGNLSSPSVLFVLEAALSGNAPGGIWWMTSFGAGFSCHGAMLEVH